MLGAGLSAYWKIKLGRTTIYLAIVLYEKIVSRTVGRLASKGAQSRRTSDLSQPFVVYGLFVY